MEIYKLGRDKRYRNPYLPEKPPPTLLAEFAKLSIGVVAGAVLLVAIISITVPPEYQKQVYVSVLLGVLMGALMAAISR